MFQKQSIPAKLALLAGVPVFGALLLAGLLWRQAQAGAASAKALGSVEDLAELSSRISGLVQELQAERALLGITLGHTAALNDEFADPDAAPGHQRRIADYGEQLTVQRKAVDRAREQLDSFLASRDVSGLPAKLRRDMEASKGQLDELPRLRVAAASKDFTLSAANDFFTTADQTLINATGALTQLSDDGELLRSITALVSVMQVKERVSQEHALLAGVFALGAFPPGTYRSLVALTTQEQVHIDVLRLNASEEDIAKYDASMNSSDALSARSMRETALKTLDSALALESDVWFRKANTKVGALRELESQLTQKVRLAALAKRNAIRASIQATAVLSIGVLVLSTLLGFLVARGIARSLSPLMKAVAVVRRAADFSVRAKKTSGDELGQLTDAFNEMLEGIERRDGELSEYRHGLETKVAQRTHELTERNNAMRLVLDNVQQGLATIRADGSLDTERSMAFDNWFGPASGSPNFASHLAADAPEVAASLTLGWEQVAEAFLPTDLTLAQMPTKLRRGERHYTLSYRGLGAVDAPFTGALLVVNDVTEELKLVRQQAEQREAIAIFERLTKDRQGFTEFFQETGTIVARILEDSSSLQVLMRDIHTVKGNCGVFQIHSIAEVCHQVEESCIHTDRPSIEALHKIGVIWKKFTDRANLLLGDGKNGVELTREEWLELVQMTQDSLPHRAIREKLELFSYERLGVRLQRLGEQACGVAERLGKPGLELQIEDNNVRLPPDELATFWSNFSHVIRNAVDHGIESPDERQKLGKSPHGKLKMVASLVKHEICVEVTDDGRGIAWERVRQKASALGLAHTSQRDLENALFADGLSTRDQVSDVSGRGVGMAAVWQTVQDLGGRITVESAENQGTTFRFMVPLRRLSNAS